jgi:ABC-type dipeptide/oligopeptide/nickel transport system permease subunit
VSVSNTETLQAETPIGPWQDFWNHLKQNRGAIIGLSIVAFFTLLALLANWISPHAPDIIHSGKLRLPPFWSAGGTMEFPLGTDDVGRDLLARLFHGARISLSIGVFTVVLSMSFGTLLGLISGYYGGLWDKTIMRLMDILMALPSILLAIVVVSVLGPGIENAVVAVSIVAIPNFTRIVRASVMAEKRKQYVMASKTFGASDWRIMFKEILPNCMAPLIVQSTLGMSDGILNAAALGFLGLGAQPPTPEWGIMLSDARPYIESSPWMVTMPGLCILLVVLGLNLFGDGLRDALDPRLKK